MLLRVSAVVLVVYGGLLGLTYWEFIITPKGFIPPQDMGYLMVNVQLPDAASAERTEALTDACEQICHETPGRQAHGGAWPGMSFLLSATSSNLRLDVRHPRRFRQARGAGTSADAIAAKLRAKRFDEEIPEAMVTCLAAPRRSAAWAAPADSSFMVEDRGDLGLTTPADSRPTTWWTRAGTS